MKSIARGLAGAAAILTASAAFGQVPAYEERPYEERRYQEAAYQGRLPQRELDQILAPVALYPDSLLSQLLMAATYPRDVAEAARWSRDNPGLQGDDAVRAVEREPWDPSVKSLVAFPEVLLMMGDRLDWTARLGEAFLAQEEAVMVTVQELRHRADEAGNLRSSDRMAVERAGDAYVIEQASAEVAYVPYYDPRVVYGSWWWPDYQPVYWNPWPGYAYYSGIGFGWGRGISLRRNFFYGGFDWGRRHVRYSAHRPYYFSGNNYWRGWRDQRRDGRHYTYDRSQGTQPRYERREQPRYERRDQPRYERREGTQRADAGTRSTPRAERADGSIRRYDPSLRTVAPRYNIDGARVRGARIQTERQSAAPNVGAQRNGIVRPDRAERAAQPAQRAAQPSQRAAQPSQRSSETGRSGGNQDGGNRGGGGRGRDR